MIVDLAVVGQLKLPVTDLEASARWYCRVFGLEVAAEFVEADELTGAALAKADRSGFALTLRLRERCASNPVLAGHDIVAFMLPDVAAIEDLADRLDQASVAHSEVQLRGPNGAALDVPDPDGTILRFVGGPHLPPPGEFHGYDFGVGGPPTFYQERRLNFT